MCITLKIKDHEILIDKEDLDILEESKWHISFKDKNKTKGYVQRNHSEEVYLHRLLLNCPKGKTVDHINGNSFDNRKRNLRICTANENHMNRSKRRGKTSSNFIGVYYNKQNKNYRAQLKVGEKRIEVGSFKTAEEAAKARDEMAKKYFGEFAHTNYKRGG